MTEQEKRLCTKKTDGIITSFKSRGLDYPNVVTVNYTAEGKTYALEESLYVRSAPIVFCGLHIGQKKKCVIDARVGNTVSVCYNPSNPHYAYLIDNVGRFNV